MIRPTAGPPTVSSPRRHAHRRTFSVMLALIGTAACGGENLAGPHSPEVASPTGQLSVPGVASLTTVAEQDAAKAEVENQRVSINAWNAELQTGLAPIPPATYPTSQPPTDPYYPYYPADPPPGGGCSGWDCPLAYSISVGAASSSSVPLRGIPQGRTAARGLLRLPTAPHFIIGGCPEGPQYWYCQQQCAQMRADFTGLRQQYDLLYIQFIANFAPPFLTIPLNFKAGGVMDQMRALYPRMYYLRLDYAISGCNAIEFGYPKLPGQ